MCWRWPPARRSRLNRPASTTWPSSSRGLRCKLFLRQRPHFKITIWKAGDRDESIELPGPEGVRLPRLCAGERPGKGAPVRRGQFPARLCELLVRCVQREGGLERLTNRVEDVNITRVANDLYGDVAPYLFPEDIALRQLGVDYSSFTIKGKTEFLERDVFQVEGIINNDLYTEGGTISMLIDQQTGIVLEYTRNSINSKVEMKMESISIDEGSEIDLYSKYIK